MMQPMSAAAFPRVLAAEAVSNLGSMLSRLAIPWLATLALAATPLQMSALVVADVLAAAAGGVGLAAWVDRRGKRAVMLAADGVRALLFALLALAVWRGVAGLALLVAVAAVHGASTAVFELARSAWCAENVPAAELPRRNAQLVAAGSLSETLAFAAGGWAYQLLGAAWSLAVDAASFVASALCLRGVPDDARAPAGPAGAASGGDSGTAAGRWRQALADAASGLELVRGHPGLRRLATIEWLLAASGSLFGIAYLIAVTRDAGFAPGPLGMVFALGGVGALLGAAAGPALGQRLGAGGAMALGLTLCALGSACVPLAIAGGPLGLALLVLHQVVGDGGRVVHDIHDRTLRQTLADPGQLARADAGVRLAGQVAQLAAAMGGGLLGAWWPPRDLLWLATTLVALAALLALAGRRRLRAA